MSIAIGDPRPAGEEGRVGDTREAGEEGPAGDPRPVGSTTSSFDPGAHTVEEVNAYLAGVGDDERQRVIDAEKADKNRVSITG